MFPRQPIATLAGTLRHSPMGVIWGPGTLGPVRTSRIIRDLRLTKDTLTRQLEDNAAASKFQPPPSAAIPTAKPTTLYSFLSSWFPFVSTASSTPAISRAAAQAVNPQKTAELVKADIQKLLQAHVDAGLDLIRNGEYRAAIEHFEDKEVLKQADISLNYAATQAHSRIPSTNGRKGKILKSIDNKNWFKSDEQTGHKSITLAPLYFFNKGAEVFPKSPAQSKVLKELQREQALMYAEEHIHALQNLNGGNLTFHPTTHVDADHEIDIATTMKQAGVSMTPAFRKRYNRQAYI
jgi:hypothetical protein